MAGPWGGLGATRYRWRADVRRIVHQALAAFPHVTANTYVCHPWCGWGRVSIDYWGPGGRGDALRPGLAEQLRRFHFSLAAPPIMRHCIAEHDLWTSWGGYSYWRPNDHSGNLRHFHVTYYK